jgi:two-component system nitrogen regulation response regulator NtrX
MNNILIIDDEPGVRSSLASILEDEKYRVYSAPDALKGFEILETERVDLVFLDVLLPKMGGLEALERLKNERPGLEVIMISGHANVDMAVRAVKLGAFDFLEKPLSLDKVLTVCRNALAMGRLREENRALRRKVPAEELIGSSPAIEQLRLLLHQAAMSDARILITGENGSGKDIAARAIHQASSRRDMPFVEVNCAAIPDSLIESELFGHEKGAFTGALAARKGRFELADKGTLFLDEIGDMSASAQSKVLRAIQEQKIERVGGEASIEVDVRIIAATNKDLEEECRAGRFRQDLFFRLNVIPVHIPPLRERAGDIPLLLHHFLEDSDVRNFNLDQEMADYLAAYPWPGNVRELKNFAERIAVMYNGEGLESIRRLLGSNGQKKEKKTGINDLERDIFNLGYNEAKELFEKTYLEYKLSSNGNSVSKTAENIGVYPGNLHGKLKKYGIRIEG